LTSAADLQYRFMVRPGRGRPLLRGQRFRGCGGHINHDLQVSPPLGAHPPGDVQELMLLSSFAIACHDEHRKAIFVAVVA
jgi:hypothetical protein